MPLNRILAHGTAIILLLLGAVGVLNLVLGIMFTAWNRNRNHLGNDYVDAPYVYYQQSGTSSGFAIPDTIPLQKRNGEFRVLLLGGSVAYALAQVKESNGTPLLQKLLQQQLRITNLQLLNGALPAYVSAQELIALQLQLRKYQPDCVVALHGFNDAESFRVNHNADVPRFLPSPIFYAGDEFSPALQAVQAYKNTYTLKGVWEAYTRYIRKAYHFIIRSLGLKRYAYEDYSKVTAETLQRYTNAYLQNIGEIRRFCDANDIRYVDLLQPVRFYRTGDSMYHRINEKDVAPEVLAQLYYQFEKGSKSLPGHVSLTNIHAASLEFTDACHPSENGYRVLAQAVADAVAAVYKNAETQP
ncbi:MAG: SGNH/GDSL hydrolase family protein [Lacibacter sp.]